MCAGGALGTLLRYGISEALTSSGRLNLLPLLLVNVAGAFGLGWFISRPGQSGARTASVHGFVAIGLLGSFTTFSAFSVETVELYGTGSWLVATGFLIGSVVAGLIAASVAAGIAAKR